MGLLTAIDVELVVVASRVHKMRFNVLRQLQRKNKLTTAHLIQLVAIRFSISAVLQSEKLVRGLEHR